MAQLRHTDTILLLFIYRFIYKRSVSYRFLVLCHFSMPDVFTVKAAFNLPGSGGGNSRAGVGSLEPVSLRGARRLDESLARLGSQPLRIITAASLEEESRLGRIVNHQRQGVSERQSRTLRHQAQDMFGGRELGREEREGDTVMLLLVVGVAGLGGLVLTLWGLATACRGRQKRGEEGVSEQEEEESVKQESEHTDRDKLQPESQKKKRESIV